METTARASNLQAMLASDDDLRQSVIEMVTTLQSIEREDARGYRLANLLDPTSPAYSIESKAKPFELEDQLYQMLRTFITQGSGDELLLPRTALSVDEISIGGVSYGTAGSTKFQNSAIIFQSSDHRPFEDKKAGIVQTIFQYTYTPVAVENHKVAGFYLLVQEHLPMDVTSGRTDPYKAFGAAGGFLCKANAIKMHIIRLSQVVSHFVLIEMKESGYEQLILVIPVDQVDLSFFLTAVAGAHWLL